MDVQVGSWLGQAVFAGALVLIALLERLQFKLRESESSKWWASNGRDVLNVVALAVMVFGLDALGLTGPVSLGIATTALILLTAAQPMLNRRRHGLIWGAAAALTLGLPILIAPQQTHQGFRTLLVALFGTGN